MAPSGTVSVYLVTVEPEKLIEFVTEAFGAVETFRTATTGTGMHAEVKIGDSIVMIGGGEASEAFPAMLHVYVDDVDATYERALKAGAASIEEPTDQHYGDRRGAVKDRFGNKWFLAKQTVPKPCPES